MSSMPPSVIYEGEMSDSKSSGKGKQYYSIYRSESAAPSGNVYGPLCYDGDWKYDVYDGLERCMTIWEPSNTKERSATEKSKTEPARWNGESPVDVVQKNTDLGRCVAPLPFICYFSGNASIIWVLLCFFEHGHQLFCCFFSVHFYSLLFVGRSLDTPNITYG